jgi:hypothetical protein
MSSHSPDTVAPQGDAGAETAQRYFYQYSYTAVLACALMDTDSDVAEIYCEHHDDILAKRRDNKIHAIQVKTRQLGSELWKSGDKEMIDTLVRFAKLEHDFPDRFWRYTIATNHQFFEVRENGSNLPYLLRLAFELAVDGVPAGCLATFVQKLVKAAECDQPLVLGMLKKANCDHRPPKLDDILNELCDALRLSCADSADASYGTLAAAADALTAEVARASSLRHSQSIPLYLSLRWDAADAETKLLIGGKRLTRERIQAVLKTVFGTPELLSPANPSVPRALPAGETRLRKKLDAGGLSAMTVDVARDCYSAAFKQQREWAAKYGEKKAIERYHHISTIMRAEAAQAYEETVSDVGLFGREMLRVLRERLRLRRQSGGAELLGCVDEHLLGYAYMLTDDCKVWWSKAFDLSKAS